MWDEATRLLTAMGLRTMRHGNGRFTFPVPVDVEYSTDTGEGTIYAQAALRPEDSRCFQFDSWVPVGDKGWKTHNSTCAAFRKAEDKTGKAEDEV